MINILSSLNSNKSFFCFKLFLAFVLIFLVYLYYTYLTSGNSYDRIFSILIPNSGGSRTLDKLNEFREIHQKIIDGKLPMKVSINGFTEAGYANKLYSMLTSLVIAILTDSALVIRWHNINNYIKEPLNLSFHSFSNTNNELNADFKSNEIFYAADAQGWYPKKNMNILVKTQIPMNKTRILFDHYEAYFFEICSNPIYFDKLLYYDLVRRETSERAKQVAYGNYSNDVKTNDILQVGYEVGGNLLNRMWIPKDFISKMINYYLNNIFKGYYMIGMQLRYHYLTDELDTKTFIKCATMIEASQLNSNNSTNQNLYPKGFKWFVTSDSEEILSRIKNTYPEKVIVGNGTMGHILADINAYTRAILDLELLSRCNELIITGGSTYGFVAAMKNQKLPYYVNGRRNATNCLRATFNEPPLTDTGFAVFR